MPTFICIHTHSHIKLERDIRVMAWLGAGIVHTKQYLKTMRHDWRLENDAQRSQRVTLDTQIIYTWSIYDTMTKPQTDGLHSTEWMIWMQRHTTNVQR